MTDLTWRTERRRISDLVPHPNNPRKMSEEQVEQLRSSIERFNLVEIPAIDADNTILAGHQRLRVMQLIGRGEEEVEVRVPSRPLTPEERDEYLIRSNKNVGEWDFDLLANFDEPMLLATGFSKVELHERFGLQGPATEDDFDEESERDAVSDAKSKLGEVYQLGRHRLLCGDSTDPAQVAILMDGAKADMVFTDPPYNVNYTYAKYESLNKPRRKKFMHGGAIFNDNMPPKEFEAWLGKVFKNAYDFSTDESPAYVCHSTSTQEQFFHALADEGYHYSQTIQWIKERFILAMGQDFHRVCEPMWYGWKEGKTRFTNKLMTRAMNVWHLTEMPLEEAREVILREHADDLLEEIDAWPIPRDKSADYQHPTQKPVRLPAIAIRKSSPPEGRILDLFGGGVRR